MTADTAHAPGDTETHQMRQDRSPLWSDRRSMLTLLAAGLLVVLLGVIPAAFSRTFCTGPNGNVCPADPVGPDGTPVNDRFFFVHQPLDGDGSITVRLTALSGIITYPPPKHDSIVAGVVPWAKVGILLKDGTRQGAPYAAVMVTGSHGIRMQSNFVADMAGVPGGADAGTPRWLRLTHAGDTIAGYESADGEQWTLVGTARLAQLPAKTEVGLFATSPCDLTIRQGPLGGSACRFTQATGTFDHVIVEGARGGTWQQTDVGAEPNLPQHLSGKLVEADAQLSVTGSGDIGPLGTESGGRRTLASTLLGLPAGMLVVIILAARLGATRRRTAWRRAGRLLMDAGVLGAITFVVGVGAAAIAAGAGTWLVRANGTAALSAPWPTAVRVVAGSALMLALAAVFTLSLGALLGRARVAAGVAFAAIVLPQLLATLPLVSDGVAIWLLRVTPAGAFAMLQSVPRYPQVLERYAPVAGYYPLRPWAGLAVLAAYTALALCSALVRLPRTSALGAAGGR